MLANSFNLCSPYLIYTPHISIFNFLVQYAAAQIFYSLQPLFNLHNPQLFQVF